MNQRISKGMTGLVLLGLITTLPVLGCAARKAGMEENRALVAQIEDSNRQAAEAAQDAKRAARSAEEAADRADQAAESARRAAEASDRMFKKSLHK